MTDRQTIVVLDAGRFMGPELSRHLAARGHNLVLHAAGPTLMEELAATDARVTEVTADEVPLSGSGSLATPDGIAAILDRCLTEYDAFSGAVVRSGNFVPGTVWDVDEGGLDALFDNVRVTTYALRAFAGELAERGRGSILLCTSAHSLRPHPELGLYAAMRAAENSLVRSTALAVAGRAVTINAVATNFMRFPEFRGGWRDEFEHELTNDIPTSRFGSMAELAAFCVPLLEGGATHLTGQVLSWSGGWA